MPKLTPDSLNRLWYSTLRVVTNHAKSRNHGNSKIGHVSICEKSFLPLFDEIRCALTEKDYFEKYFHVFGKMTKNAPTKTPLVTIEY